MPEQKGGHDIYVAYCPSVRSLPQLLCLMLAAAVLLPREWHYVRVLTPFAHCVPDLASYPKPFNAFASVLLNIDQSYFMCLFFFISAYFSPTSYERKG